jgi:predicted NACHT family NTPase
MHSISTGLFVFQTSSKILNNQGTFRIDKPAPATLTQKRQILIYVKAEEIAKIVNKAAELITRLGKVLRKRVLPPLSLSARLNWCDRETTMSSSQRDAEF